jgi:sensor c-di-GMP phosphodiesterase-like protein
MLPTTSYIFSTDNSASGFRRAVRRQVASRAEYAPPGAGASAQEVQAAYLRYMRTNNRGMRNSSNAAPYTHTEKTEEAPPVYTATAASATPTARLNTLLYSNVCVVSSPPEYEDAVSPPRYEDVVAARTRSPIPSSSATTTLSHTPNTSQSQSQSQSSNSSNAANNHLSHQKINQIFAGSTSRTHRKQLNDTAVQALCLVVGSDGPALPPREAKKRGWGRGKRRGMRGLRRV